MNGLKADWPKMEKKLTGTQRTKDRNTTEIIIGNRTIGPDHPVFIIAEAGCNHNGDLELAKKLIDVAVAAKADAVKFQTFITEKETTQWAPKAKYAAKNTEKTESQYDMLKNMELTEDEHAILKSYADSKGIVFFSTPYEIECVDLLMRLKVPLMKISSGELNNPFLLMKVAKTGLPVILSTGMSTMEEITAAVRTITTYNKQLVLLHCTSNYPTAFEDVNLRAMHALEQFGCPIGYSDHTEGILVPLVAVARGACIIEKHITIDKLFPGPDHKASLEPEELAEMVREIRAVERILGSSEKRVLGSEQNTREVARRSIVPVEEIRPGQPITAAMLTFKKPGTGLPPGDIHKIIGKRAKVRIARDELINLDMLQ